ncbi:MAG: hypothetical protein ACPK7O_04715 [Methanobacterium sp.]
MPFVCDKCGKNHNIKKGENSISKKCECGGSIKFVQNFDMHVIDELDPT